jgi:hypothetical protein
MGQYLVPPSGLLFKRLLLLFWTMFFSMVALTNLVNLLDSLGLFDWTFLDSGNFDYLRDVVGVYGVGGPPTKLLLLGALLIEGIAAMLFWRALLGFGIKRDGERLAMTAVCWGTLVWTSFVFMTEFFVAYGAESPFRELMAIMVGTGIALALIPDDVGHEAHS